MIRALEGVEALIAIEALEAIEALKGSGVEDTSEEVVLGPEMFIWLLLL
jgi:hypothetical protein